MQNSIDFNCLTFTFHYCVLAFAKAIKISRMPYDYFIVKCYTY